MTISNNGIKRIVELWALGASAEETVKRMRDEGFKIAIASVYRHRHSITASQMVEEITRRQLRDIAQADMPLALKYRDKLLEKMMPHKIEQHLDAQVNYPVMPFELDPEIKAILIASHERQKAEKDGATPAAQ